MSTASEISRFSSAVGFCVATTSHSGAEYFCMPREQFGQPNATIVHDPARATEAMLLQVKAD
jgi:hypothetical protein